MSGRRMTRMLAVLVLLGLIAAACQTAPVQVEITNWEAAAPLTATPVATPKAATFWIAGN